MYYFSSWCSSTYILFNFATHWFPWDFKWVWENYPFLSISWYEVRKRKQQPVVWYHTSSPCSYIHQHWKKDRFIHLVCPLTLSYPVFKSISYSWCFVTSSHQSLEMLLLDKRLLLAAHDFGNCHRRAQERLHSNDDCRSNILLSTSCAVLEGSLDLSIIRHFIPCVITIHMQHHFVTSALILGSYFMNFTPFGLVILWEQVRVWRCDIEVLSRSACCLFDLLPPLM